MAQPSGLTGGIIILVLIAMPQLARASVVSTDIQITAYVAPSSCLVAVEINDGRAEELPGCVNGSTYGGAGIGIVISGGLEEPVQLKLSMLDVIY